MRVDADSDAILELLVTAWMTGLERPAVVAYGDGTAGTWQPLNDPLHAPLWALPHAAQWTGGTMPVRQPGETDDAYLARAREEVVRPRGMLRGSRSALATIGRNYLTGTQYISIVEWVDGSPWRLVARVHEDECADPAALVAALNAPDTIPAGMHVDVVLSTGQVWDELAGAWDDLPGSWDVL